MIIAVNPVINGLCRMELEVLFEIARAELSKIRHTFFLSSERKRCNFRGAVPFTAILPFNELIRPITSGKQNRESRRNYDGPPIKTFRGDDLEIKAFC